MVRLGLVKNGLACDMFQKKVLHSSIRLSLRVSRLHKESLS